MSRKIKSTVIYLKTFNRTFVLPFSVAYSRLICDNNYVSHCPIRGKFVDVKLRASDLSVDHFDNKVGVAG